MRGALASSLAAGRGSERRGTTARDRFLRCAIALPATRGWAAPLLVRWTPLRLPWLSRRRYSRTRRGDGVAVRWIVVLLREVSGVIASVNTLGSHELKKAESLLDFYNAVGSRCTVTLHRSAALPRASTALKIRRIWPAPERCSRLLNQVKVLRRAERQRYDAKHDDEYFLSTP